MIVNLIESVEWTGKRSNHISQDAMDVDIEVDVDVAQEQIPKILPRDRKPKWVAGTPMQSTRIGDLRLKVAEPYWYMHQGNCEHVWTVDSIRCVLSLLSVPSYSRLSQVHPPLRPTSHRYIPLYRPVSHHDLPLPPRRCQMSHLRSRPREYRHDRRRVGGGDAGIDVWQVLRVPTWRWVAGLVHSEVDVRILAIRNLSFSHPVHT